MELELDDHAAVLPQVLGAVYAASKLSYRARADVFRLLRRATRWHGDNDERLLGVPDRRRGRLPALAHDRTTTSTGRCKVLGYNVQRRADPERHPDHVPAPGPRRPPRPRGQSSEGAGQRITDLTQAKRILLAEE